MPKFPSKVKVINIKVKVIILWIWKGHFWIRKGHFCIVCQKLGGHGPSGPPVPTSLTAVLMLKCLLMLRFTAHEGGMAVKRRSQWSYRLTLLLSK